MAKRKKNVIKRPNREDRIQKRKQAVVTYFIVILMISSVAGFALSSNSMNSSDKLEYNGFIFESTTVDHPLASGYNMNALVEKTTGALFYASPYQVEQIPTEGNVSWALKDKPYFIYTFESDATFNTVHDWLRFEFASQTTKNIIPAVISLNETYPSFPVLTCENSTIDMPVIFIEQGNSTIIRVDENACVQIKTRSQDILMVRDRLFYSFSGIMNT
ncbi:hypothetical protein K9M74_03905 [Candidatus Woesearchaeota archaeon]|nr:hypothetical protein [Candidatus Woesearchaeota archaeon]